MKNNSNQLMSTTHKCVSTISLVKTCTVTDYLQTSAVAATEHEFSFNENDLQSNVKSTASEHSYVGSYFEIHK